MFLFAILIYPTAILLLKKSICRKELYNFIVGLVVSSVITLLFWSLSTFFNPYSFGFHLKFVYLLLKSYVPLLLLLGVLLYRDIKGLKKISNSLIAGFIYWVSCFSTALFSGNRSFYYGFINPLLFLVLLLLVVYLYGKNIATHYKYIILFSMPIIMLLLNTFFSVNGLVFMILFLFFVITVFILFIKKEQFINEISR